MKGGTTMGILDFLRRGKRGNQAMSEETVSEIRKYYKASFDKAYDAARDKVLRDVRVYPGQDPYMAAHSAILQQEAKMTTSATGSAENQTVAKYKIKKSQLKSLL
jgi:hypothetical protein